MHNYKQTDVWEDLCKRAYTQVPFPMGKEQIQIVMGSFFEFLSLSDEVKRCMDMKIASKHRRGDLGYKHRFPEDDMYNDSKEFFHYHPVLMSHYGDYIKTQPIIQNFLIQAEPVWQAVYDVVKETLSCFETRFPNTLAKVFDTQVPHIILRFLKYDFATSGSYLAKPHFDAGSFTLAIAESSPGLRIGTNPDNLMAVEHEENKALFMVSSNYRKVIDTDLLNPGWHDVIQLDSNYVGKPFSRWALVAFIDGHDVEALSRSETHRWFKSESDEK